MSIGIAAPKNSSIYTMLLMALATLLCFQNLAYYVTFDFNIYTSLLVFPLVLKVKEKGVFSARYGWCSLAFFILYPFLKIQMCFFFGYAFFLMFIIESFIGKLNTLPLFLIAIISPLCIYFFELLGFPIRIKLTEYAASLINSLYHDVSYQGNMITVAGESFSVDRACAGLNMTVTAFLICLILIAFQEKRTNTTAGFFETLILLILTALLILLCNLFRIIGLVIFRAPPETFAHELIGIVSLAFCVILPLCLCIPLFLKFFRRNRPTLNANSTYSHSGKILIICLLPFMFLLNYNRENYRSTKDDQAIQQVNILGYKKTVLKNGVVKFTGESSLIYLKPALALYAADHTPLICWKGSGYDFKKEDLINIDGFKVYFAELAAEDDKLYTAWWYDNGAHKTTSQFDWRWRMLKGEEPFRVVNITTSGYNELLREVNTILDQNILTRCDAFGNSQYKVSCKNFLYP